jgi:hypothetical protein
MATLKTNYKDDILDLNQNDRRCFTMTTNEDNTVSFRDVTRYEQQGDSFRASDINATNTQVNANTEKIADVEDGLGNANESINGVVADLTANNKKYKADYQNGKYGFTIDNEFHPFNKGTIYLGEYSANTTIDVSDLGATSVDQFIMSVTPTNINQTQTNITWGATGGNAYCTATYTAPTLALNNGTLTLTVGSLSATGGGVGNWYGGTSASSTNKVKLYYVGDIETR